MQRYVPRKLVLKTAAKLDLFGPGIFEKRSMARPYVQPQDLDQDLDQPNPLRRKALAGVFVVLAVK
jgi:hypothetical protein